MKFILALVGLLLTQSVYALGCVTGFGMGDDLDISHCVLIVPQPATLPADFCKKAAKPDPRFNIKLEIVDECPSHYVARCSMAGSAIKESTKENKNNSNGKPKIQYDVLPDNAMIYTYYYSDEAVEMYESTCFNGIWTIK